MSLITDHTGERRNEMPVATQEQPSDDGGEQSDVVVHGVDVVGAADEDNVDVAVGGVLVGARSHGRRGSGGRGGKEDARGVLSGACRGNGEGHGRGCGKEEENQ